MTITKIYYCDHQYGSGKTSAWLDHCAARVQLRNQCIVYPTLALLRQKLILFRQRAERHGLAADIREITSDTSRCVINDLMEFFNAAGSSQKRVLFMTYQAWLELPHLHHLEEWEFCFDDCATKPFIDLTLKLADQHALLTDLLEPVDTSAVHSLLRVRDGQSGRLQQIAENSDGDDVLAVVSRVARTMTRSDAWYGIWCNVENWQRVSQGAVRGESEDERLKRRALFLQAEINPKRFIDAARTTFLRTRWSGTLMHLNATRNHNLRFDRHPSIKPSGTAYMGAGLRIVHYQDAIFSKHNRDQPVENGPTRFEQFQRHIEAVHQGQSYGVVMNNDKLNAGVRFRGAVPIPPDCAGREDFANLTSVAAPIALRHRSSMMSFLHDRKITSQEADDDLYAEGIAQVIMRSAARCKGFAGEVTAHVMDGWVAQRLLERFPMAIAERETGVVSPVVREHIAHPQKRGRRRLYATGAQRTAGHRARKRAAKLTVSASAIETRQVKHPGAKAPAG
jgi:hypothetical protein